MEIKASVLLGHVGQFVRKLRHMSPEAKALAVQLPQFVQLESDLDVFRFVILLLLRARPNSSRSFPVSLRDPLQPCSGYTNRLDPDLIVSGSCHNIKGV